MKKLLALVVGIALFVAIPVKAQNWTTYNGHEYALIGPGNFNQVFLQSQSLGGRLVTIGDINEYVFVRNLCLANLGTIKTHGYHVWLGAWAALDLTYTYYQWNWTYGLPTFYYWGFDDPTPEPGMSITINMAPYGKYATRAFYARQPNIYSYYGIVER